MSTILSNLKCITGTNICMSAPVHALTKMHRKKRGKFSFQRWSKCRRENTLFLLLSIYFDPSCPTSFIKHLFLIPVRRGYCFRWTLSSYIQKRIAWFTLPDFLSVPDSLKLYKSKVTPVSVQLHSTWSWQLCTKLATIVLFGSQVGIKIVIPKIQSSLCTNS